MSDLLVIRSLAEAEKIRRPRNSISWLCRHGATLFLNGLFRLFYGRKRKGGMPGRILIYTVGILGDNIVVLPLLKMVRNAYPDSHIILVNNSQVWSPTAAKELFSGCPYIDEYIEFLHYDCPVQRRGFRFELVDAPEIQDLRCDLFINLSPFANRGWPGGLWREILWAGKNGAGTIVFGPLSSISRSWSAEQAVNEPRRWRQIAEQLFPAGYAGFVPQRYDELADPQNLLPELRGQKYWVVNPGAKFRAKCWAPERFGEIAKRLSERYWMRFVVLGTPAERALCEEVVRHSGGAAVSYAGRTDIKSLMALVAHADGYLGNDTGTMHIAALFRIPVIAFFTPHISLGRWFPDSREIVAFCSSTRCEPCNMEECTSLRCMAEITTEEIGDIVEAFVQNCRAATEADC